MKTITIILFLFAIVITSFAQENEEVLSKKELKTLEKEKKALLRSEEDKKSTEITKLMLENHRFVLEADFITGRGGNRIPVSSSLNFIIVDSLEGTLQLANPWGMGTNGLGGITLDGRISKYDLFAKESKRGISYSLTLFINSSLGSYDIQFWISQTGNATATVRGNTSGSLTYSGKLVPLGISRVYKGHSYP